MTVYEIKACGGEWEDRFDDHVCAYLSKEVAEKKCAELNQQELLDREQAHLCAKCPLAYKSWKTKEEFETDKKEHEYYAPCVKDATARCEDYPWGMSIYNDCWHGCRDDCRYYIFEMEVEE